MAEPNLGAKRIGAGAANAEKDYCAAMFELGV
jgi:hypothetical protein